MALENLENKKNTTKDTKVREKNALRYKGEYK